MARKIKIDNAELKRFARTQKKRQMGNRPDRQYFLIVCEGAKTEPNYFESIKKTLPPGVVNCIEIEGEGRNTLNLIDECIKIRARKEKSLRRVFDQTWAVFDRDSFPPENFNNAINKGENLKNKIYCAWSNEAFELWYLLHLEYVNVPMSRVDYQPKIQDWLTTRMGEPFQYRKNRRDMYEILQKYGDEKQAINWAQKLDQQHEDFEFAQHNPCTKVYKLIIELNQLKV